MDPIDRGRNPALLDGVPQFAGHRLIGQKHPLFNQTMGGDFFFDRGGQRESLFVQGESNFFGFKSNGPALKSAFSQGLGDGVQGLQFLVLFALLLVQNRLRFTVGKTTLRAYAGATNPGVLNLTVPMNLKDHRIT